MALDFHAGQFEGGDPGRLTIQQFNANEDQSTAPFDRAWVDRYSAVLRDEWTFAEGWLMQAKGWFTHQDIDNRNQSFRGAPPFPTTLQNDEFNNFGGDLRFRWNWGAGTALKGSTLTFGGTVYHGDAPLNRYSTFDLTADRFDTSGTHTLDQSRNSDYQAFFIENIFRFGKFHIVPSFRLDHESVDVDTNIGPTLGSRSADHVVPLWGVGLGNDFGHLNETLLQRFVRLAADALLRCLVAFPAAQRREHARSVQVARLRARRPRHADQGSLVRCGSVLDRVR